MFSALAAHTEIFTYGTLLSISFPSISLIWTSNRLITIKFNCRVNYEFVCYYYLLVSIQMIFHTISHPFTFNFFLTINPQDMHWHNSTSSSHSHQYLYQYLSQNHQRLSCFSQCSFLIKYSPVLRHSVIPWIILSFLCRFQHVWGASASSTQAALMSYGWGVKIFDTFCLWCFGDFEDSLLGGHTGFTNCISWSMVNVFFGGSVWGGHTKQCLFNFWGVWSDLSCTLDTFS